MVDKSGLFINKIGNLRTCKNLGLKISLHNLFQVWGDIVYFVILPLHHHSGLTKGVQCSDFLEENYHDIICAIKSASCIQS